MNVRLLHLGIVFALLMPAVTAQASQVDEYALEPCMNGGVSATGLFASQAEEDRYLAERLALELDPCSDRRVSASDEFASQAQVDGC